jgi:hypothetical protein
VTHLGFKWIGGLTILPDRVRASPIGHMFESALRNRTTFSTVTRERETSLSATLVQSSPPNSDGTLNFSFIRS